ncbi:MAG: hypothetical protein E2O56_07380 [Gammaproteobacteria bacterium]|nr:MAG: hypothetical protein E2O56_07380 [Gammaproteobacteria bacterium]
MSTRLAAIPFLLLLLGACGQKGDLYLRDDAAAPSSGQETVAQDQEQGEEQQEDEE